MYTGISTNVQRRFREHCEIFKIKKGKGAKFFLGHEPKNVVWTETFINRSEASVREAEIKKMSSSQKRKLILSKHDLAKAASN